MKEKIFLTSALAMGFVAPVFAEPSNTGDFPYERVLYHYETDS